MKIEGRWRRSIELNSDGRSVDILDQTKLPYAISWMRLASLDEAARAIADMHVRGAPLIGVTAAYGVAISLHADAGSLARAVDVLGKTRPTAVNLRWALDTMRRRLEGIAPGELAARAFAIAAELADGDAACCEAIGVHGLELIRAASRRRPERPVQILTHCNAGWLATVDWGTALAPIYKAHEAGIEVHVWVDETRPRNQGMLTAFELAQHGVPHTVIADNAGGHLMQRGQVDLCIVGTDRTTRNGDVANKIGTYLKALAASDNGIPFYVALPSSTIDWSCAEGHEIPIEERSGDEVRFVAGHGADGSPSRVQVVSTSSAVANPAFDVTPRRLVTGLVTERGVAPASAAGLRSLFPYAADAAEILT